MQSLYRIFLLPLLLVISLATGAYALNSGEAAPDFTLKSNSGQDVKLSDYRGKVVVLEWFNEGCPYVQKHYSKGFMQQLQSKYTARDVAWLTINSTAPDHRDYLSPEQTTELMRKRGVKSTSFLIDSTGAVGKLYGAKTTPHMFVIDPTGKLVYQGAIDDNNSPSGDPTSAKNYVQQTIDELISGKAVTLAETKPYGCSVKYSS